MGMKHTVLITGAAGYVGAMLVDQWSKRPDVERIIGLDREQMPEFLKEKANLVWIRKNTADDWEAEAAKHNPTLVVHTAWQIRTLYGKGKEQWRWNVDGSRKVFRFAFATPSVTKLVHFGTASTYSARPGNTLERRYSEQDPIRRDDYLYAMEKAAAEEALKEERENNARGIPVVVVRPAAVTGPRGRFMRERFGLQSALAGTLKGSAIYRAVNIMTWLVPATKKWCRQFVHEDDLADILTLVAFSDTPSPFEIYNLAPPGEVVGPRDMAAIVGKKIIWLHPRIIQVMFFIMYHLTRGKIPTSRGGWRFYSFPIVMDGTKVTRDFGFSYAHESKDAFSKTAGRYEYAVPADKRVA